MEENAYPLLCVAVGLSLQRERLGPSQAQCQPGPGPAGSMLVLGHLLVSRLIWLNPPLILTGPVTAAYRVVAIGVEV